MPEIVFHPDIASEVKASFDWYQDQAAGLGEDLIAELEVAYDANTELPGRGQNFKWVFVDSCFPDFHFP